MTWNRMGLLAAAATTEQSEACSLAACAVLADFEKTKTRVRVAFM